MANANTTADRAIEILMMFEDARPVLTAADVAERFKMPRSTTYRYLSTLRGQGLLSDTGDGGYRLGPRIFTLARIARQGFSLPQAARPELERLLKETGETVLLTQLNGADLNVLECLETSAPIRISYERGSVLPSPASASAKVFLAFESPAVVQKLIGRRRIAAYTSSTITDPNRIREALEQVRELGYAVNYNEVDDGITAVAAPIFDSASRVRHSISVVAPSFRLTPERVPVVAEQVKAAASRISVLNSAIG